MTDPHRSSTVTRRQFLAGAGLAGAAWVSRPWRAVAEDAQQTQRPNILFLLTDDQRWDCMSCAGHPILHTPNMDRLVQEGMRFTNAFVTTPICAASRASIFTGLYERRHRYTFGAGKFIRIDDWEQIYPMRLRAAGYRTGFIGKFGVTIHGSPNEQFDFFRGAGPFFPKIPENKDGEHKHLTSIMGDHAVEFLQGCSANQPFCLSVSFRAPHVEDPDPRQFLYDPAYKDMFADVTIPPPPKADPRFFAALPPWVQTSEGRRRWKIRFSTPEKYQEMVKGYFRLIYGVDVVIGRIRDELTRLGLADNTVIVFSSDNGFFLGERGLAGKWFLYEESIRVPLIISDPRLPQSAQGKICSELALNIDVSPTIQQLAGVDVPSSVQGQSLIPLARGQSPEWRHDFLCEHLWDVSIIPRSEGVRTERWKYIHYPWNDPSWEELYDLRDDPLEMKDLAKDPHSAATLQQLRARCAELVREAQGPPRTDEALRRDNTPVDTTTDLLAYWSCDALDKDTTPETVGKLGPAKVTEARRVPGVHGQALAFDGSTAYVRAGTIPPLKRTDDFTWTFWVYLEPGNKSTSVILGNRRHGKADPLQFIKFTPDKFAYYSKRHAGTIAYPIPTSKWTAIAVVKKGGELTYYANGEQVGYNTTDVDMPALPLFFGGDPDAKEMSACRLDDIRLYTRALTPNDIAALAKPAVP